MTTSNQSDEEARIASLRALGILDTPPQPMFDRITQLAASLFDAQIAAISLVDEDRVWTLSLQGCGPRESPRAVSFCNHAIADKGQLYVPDASADERFCDNPSVTGEPKLRTYLGQPITGPDGARVGTLCVIDSTPNKFEGLPFAKLEVLAHIVGDLIVAHQQAQLKDQLADRLSKKNKDLKKANRIFVAAEQTARIGSWELDCETSQVSWSQGVYAIHGISPGQPLTLETAINAYAPQDREMVSETVRRAIEQREAFSFEADLENSAGDIRRVLARGECLPTEHGKSDRIVGVLTDITESHHAQAALQRAADYDSLTDMYNRHALDRILGETIKRQRTQGAAIGLLLLDLDGFKAINDTFGHLIGDMVLEEVSGRLRRTLPDNVVAARWGGDEFVFIAPLGSTREDIEHLWHKLDKAVKEPFYISGRKLVMHATGGAEVSHDTIGGRELVRRADLAMYNAKRRESGSLQFYGEELEKDNREKQEAINEVRSAIDAGRLFASYQPIIDLLTGETVGLEALMRLRTRSGNELTATNVFPAILDPHISREIGEEMVRFICADYRKIALALPDLSYISINATEADLLSQNYATNFLDRLQGAGIAPTSVTLEVTETMLMVNDHDTARRVLNTLKDAGMQIALDDFGTGFSSLTHLRDYPIDMVKIDKSFVQSLCSDHQSRLIVQAMIAMARSLDIKVVAEGIERDEQRDLLMHMGCRYAQGFLLGVPQPNEALTARTLRNSSRGPDRGAVALGRSLAAKRAREQRGLNAKSA
ncbi:MAG: EAL domain-containing protein [Erythrobacter sp.]|nr:EAL domain-containing protein [Erythrobacter sp.]